MNELSIAEMVAEARNHVHHYPLNEGDALRVGRLADGLETVLSELASLRLRIADAIACLEENEDRDEVALKILSGHAG